MGLHLDISKTTWDLSPLLSVSDDSTAEAELEQVRKAHQNFAEKWRDRDDYLTDAAVLQAALDDYEELQAKYAVYGPVGIYGKVGYYYLLRTQLDSADSEINAKHQLAINEASKIEDLTRFFESNLAKIKIANQKCFLVNPDLKEYKYFLKTIFAKSYHQLSEKEERILSLKSPISYTKWVHLVKKYVSTQERVALLPDGRKQTQPTASLLTLISHPSKQVRDSAANAVNDILYSARDIAEAELNAILANHAVDDELYSFDRPDAHRHLNDDIAAPVIDMLVQAVTARLDISHRFYRLKADLLGLPKLKYYELGIQYGTVAQEYSWDKTCRIVYESYAKLDPDFGQIFREFVNSGRFDVYPRMGKRAGACCFYFNKALPVYTMLNHANSVRDVITVAHEFGHGLHLKYTYKSQNSLNCNFSFATAETAVAYLEDSCYDLLLNEVDNETRLVINMDRLNYMVDSIQKAISCYQFERKLHASFRKSGYLSADQIGALFHQEMEAYMGSAIKQSAGTENWWIYWRHIRYFFRTYVYAFGLLIAKSMQETSRHSEDFISRFKAFLSAGNSASPQELFARMDIDITDRGLWDLGLDKFEKLLHETEQLAIDLGKLSNNS